MDTRSTVAATLAAVAAVLMLPAHAQNSAPTTQECSDAWKDCSARDSCGIRKQGTDEEGYTYWYIDTDQWSVVAQSNECYVNVHCYRANGNMQSNTMLTSEENVENLSNCNGSLTVGSC